MLERTKPRHLHTVQDNEVLFHDNKKLVRAGLINDCEPPDTTKAVVYCYECDLPRTHVFKGRQPIKNRADQLLYLELVFECCSCKVERVWGTEETPEEAARK